MGFQRRAGLLGKIIAASLVTGLLVGCGADSTSSGSSADSTTAGASATSQSLVSLSSDTYSAVPSSTVVLTINRSGVSEGTATVGYSTVSGTATEGTDYTPTSGNVTWEDGDTVAKMITVPISSNAGGKSFALSLTSVEGDAQFGAPAAATIQIATAAKRSSSSSSSGGSSSGSSSTGASSSTSSSSGTSSSTSSSSGTSSSTSSSSGSSSSTSSSSGSSSSTSSSSGGSSSGASSSSSGASTTASVTISWTAPTENTDGSALTSLSGYNIYYGTSATALSTKISIATVGMLVYVLSNLNHGTYYFAITSVNTAGIESAPTPTVGTTI